VTVQTPPDGFEIANLTFRFAYVDPDFEDYRPPSISLTGLFAGDIGSEMPTVSLYDPEDERGTVFEAHELGNLANETFSIDLLHLDAPEPPRPLGVVVTIELEEGRESGDRYTLRGTVRLDFQADASD